MRLRQGKGTSLLDYAFGRAPSAQALLMLGFAFGGRVELRLWRSAFGGDMRLRRKDAPMVRAPAAEEETTQTTARCSDFGRAPSAVRVRQCAFSGTTSAMCKT